MCSCDFGSQSFSLRTPRKAAKWHRCVECRGVIAKGDRYVRFSYGWEGTADSAAICLDCDAWGDALGEAQRRECGCSGWEIGGMWCAIGEFYDEHLSDDAIAMKERERLRTKPWTTVENLHHG